MEVVDALKHGELGEQAQRAFQAARETVNELVPASTDRLHDLGERVGADRYIDQVKELERDYAKRAKKIERKLEKRARKLPVDTPLDRRRRQRQRRRGATGGAIFIVLAAAGGAIAWAVWRARRPVQLPSAEPDALDTSANASTTTTGNGSKGDGAAETRSGSSRATGSKQRAS